MDAIPFRVLPSPPDRPTYGPELTSLRSPRPSTAFSNEPRVKQADHALLRFRSRAFSTPQRLPGKLEFHDLISCRNRP
jgi:hypothetical protein